MIKHNTNGRGIRSATKNTGGHGWTAAMIDSERKHEAAAKAFAERKQRRVKPCEQK